MAAGLCAPPGVDVRSGSSSRRLAHLGDEAHRPTLHEQQHARAEDQLQDLGKEHRHAGLRRRSSRRRRKSVACEWAGGPHAHRVLFTLTLADTAVAQQQDVTRVLEAHEDQRAVLEKIHHVETCRRGARVRRTRARLSGRRVCANLAPAPPAAPRSAGAPFGSTLSHHPCRPRARTRRGESVVWLRRRERSRTRSLAAAAGSAGHASGCNILRTPVDCSCEIWVPS